MAQAIYGPGQRDAMMNRLEQAFQKADANNTGSVDKSQFDSIFSIMKVPSRLKAEGADAVYKKLDPQKTGKVSKQDFVDGMMKELDRMRAEGRAGNNPPPNPESAPPPQQNQAYATANNRPQTMPPDKLAYSPQSLKSGQASQAGQYSTAPAGTKFNAYA